MNIRWYQRSPMNVHTHNTSTIVACIHNWNHRLQLAETHHWSYPPWPLLPWWVTIGHTGMSPDHWSHRCITWPLVTQAHHLTTGHSGVSKSQSIVNLNNNINFPHSCSDAWVLTCFCNCRSHSGIWSQDHSSTLCLLVKLILFMSHKYQSAIS